MIFEGANTIHAIAPLRLRPGLPVEDRSPPALKFLFKPVMF